MSRKETDGKDRKRKDGKRIIAIISITVFLALFLAYYIVQQDVSIDTSDETVSEKTSQVIERQYFDISLTRIPLTVLAYDPNNNTEEYTIGANADNDRLDFGILPIDAPARKSLEMSNNRDSDVKVRLSSSGNISDRIKFDDVSFMLAPGESRDIMIHLTGVPEKTRLSGEMQIGIMVPKEGYQTLVHLA